MYKQLTYIHWNTYIYIINILTIGVIVDDYCLGGF